MNEQNKHAALTIAQQYPPAQYNLLVPMQTVTEIADIQKPVMNSVKISTDLNDGEAAGRIYEVPQRDVREQGSQPRPPHRDAD